MKPLIRLVFVITLLFPALCIATTWGDAEVAEPIDPETKCKVHEPMSSGSYIYSWPSKYDQVFWPLTDDNGIWFCEKTGFTAFIGDFEGITFSEKERIAKYLKENYKGGASIEVRLKLLEGVYSLRKTDDEFDNRLLRVLARWYQELGEFDTANAYRRRALQGVQRSLNSKIQEKQKLEYLYVAANYSRFFGDVAASDKYVEELRASIERLEDKKLAGYAEYLAELTKETPRIKPGKKLDPELD